MEYSKPINFTTLLYTVWLISCEPLIAQEAFLDSEPSSSFNFQSETHITANDKSLAQVNSSVANTVLQPNQQHSIGSLESVNELALNSSEINLLKKQLELLKLKNATLSTQNILKKETYQQELLKLQQEKDHLLLMNELQQEKNRSELVKLRAEQERLVLENELQAAKQKQLLADLETLKLRLELENEIHEQEKQKMLAEFNLELDKLAMQNAIQQEKNQQEELKIELESAKLNFEIAKLEFEKNKREFALEELTEKITEREQTEVWESQVNKPKEYLIEPFVDDYLVISDRKIELDRVIIPGTAKYINERIHYYNNKSTEYPIFLVIDRCYGGSIMEGSKIIEAMHSSRAPVYVVVKTLAASMGAVITTLAKRSYAYPNAIIVHHQIWSDVSGNQKEIEEQLEIGKEWTKRLMHPVAEKMGITMDEFVKKMYENNSSGNWSEFADTAVKFKWVDKVIKDIRDTSFTKEPIAEESEEDEEDLVLLEVPFAERNHVPNQNAINGLPRLNPLDFYFLYDPK